MSTNFLHDFMLYLQKYPDTNIAKNINSIITLLVFVSVWALLIYLFSRSKKVTEFIAAKKVSGTGMFLVIVILGIAIILASELAPVVSGAKTNVRDSIALFAAVIGGPIAGIVVGLIGGIYRYTIGGWTALPCAVATILAGIISAVIVYATKFRPRNINAKNITLWAVFVAIWETVHLQVLIPLIGNEAGYLKAFKLPSVDNYMIASFNKMLDTLYIPMVVMNVLAVVTFLLLTKDMVLNDARMALDEQNRLIAEVEELRMKVYEQKNKEE